MVEPQYRSAEVGRQFPFVVAVDGGGKAVVEVQPFVRCIWLGEEGIILERMFWIT
jgi:hypothetical protein